MESLTVAAKGSIRRFVRPRKYFLAALYISMGGFLNGYDTGSIGSITEMPSFQASIAVLSPTMRGFTVSFLLLAGAVPSLFAGLLADKLGHLTIVFWGAIFFTVGAAMEAGAANLAMLLVGRGLVGVGEGLYLGNLNVYICEIAPAAQRGMLVALPQALVTLGTCLGYFTCYGTIRITGDMGWRLPFVLQAGGGVLLAVACWLLPGSPRWLIARNQLKAAERNMQRLDLEPAEIQLPLSLRNQSGEGGQERLQESEEQLSWSIIKSIFARKYRFRTVLALFILGMVQLCGIDGVLYVRPNIHISAAH
ncbi:hypothetical protein DL770_005215 [Monosporascus sp. CRB-9-2]|nr:hypothetical protein DL770_005215 [Monosporascus sp. CRB-9-2]